MKDFACFIQNTAERPTIPDPYLVNAKTGKVKYWAEPFRFRVRTNRALGRKSAHVAEIFGVH
jgi:hypothetical protein